jgi:hypothetical protein
MEGVDFFHKNQNCHSLVLPRNEIVAMFFFVFKNFFWGLIHCVYYEFKHLLEQKLIESDTLCENGTMSSVRSTLK